MNSNGLALDSVGTPYIAYADVNDGKAIVMKFDGTNWMQVGTSIGAGTTSYISPAFDSNDTPYVAYWDAANDYKTSVVKFDGTSWVQVGKAGFSAGSAAGTSLAFDSSDTPYVAYGDFAYLIKPNVMKFPSGDLMQANVTMGEDSFPIPYGNPIPFDLTLKATDPDGDTISWSIGDYPAHGTAMASGTGITKTIQYTPAANYNGYDDFVVQVSDGVLTDTATVSVTIISIPDAPVAVDDTASTAEDTPVLISLLANDSDADGDTLSVVSTDTPAHGTVSISGTTHVVYTPSLNYNGPDSFNYIVSDGLFTDAAIVTVTVTPVNDPPIADAGSDQTVTDAAAVTLDGSASSDPENQLMNYRWQQTGGTKVSLTTGVSVTTFTSPTAPTVLTFTLTITDSDGLTDSDVVSVRVADGDIAEPIIPNTETTFIVPGQGVSVTVPAGATLQPMTLVFRPLASSHSAPNGWLFAGHAFVVEAYIGSMLQTGVTFNSPVFLTLEYTDVDINNIYENTLNLYYRKGSAWAKDGIHATAWDSVNNQITFAITRLAEFALFGQRKGFSVYLPLVLK